MFHLRRRASGALKGDISIELARGHFHKVATPRALGLATTSKVLHPGSETIARAFSFLDYKVTDDTSQCTPQGRFLIAIVAAWLTRGFLNQQMPPVRVMRSSQSVALLQSVLRPLGQVAAVELGPE